jgi:nucleoside-diphosphate-sugar epimerase
MIMGTDKIMIIGACGQVGTELTLRLRDIFGNANVLATDIKEAEGIFKEGPFEILNALDSKKIAELVGKYNITQVYHLAALLSATAEKNPMFGWQLNMQSLLDVLNIAKDQKLHKVYWPSSIAVFGPNTPRINTPQHTIMDPSTVYGISKLAGERWCEYYFNKYGVDVRSIRYPGLISYKTEPGGGTTDYAVHIFYEAIKQGSYECFLSADTALPMLYMPDAIKGTIELMEAPAGEVRIRSSYNLSGFSFTPAELAVIIQKHIPEFNISKKPDIRQAIADSWPASIDDSAARKDWGWKPDYDLEAMVSDMLENISAMTGA